MTDPGCVTKTAEVEFEFITWVSSKATADFHSGSGRPEKATTYCCFGCVFFGLATARTKIDGGFWRNSGDELKLYLRHTGSTPGFPGAHQPRERGEANLLFRITFAENAWKWKKKDWGGSLPSLKHRHIQNINTGNCNSRNFDGKKTKHKEAFP